MERLWDFLKNILKSSYFAVVLAVTSILLSIILYNLSQKYPLLSYYVYPTKTLIVKENRISKLKVEFDSIRITKDISSLQFSVWNGGRKSIRDDDVLQILEIRTTHNEPILDAQVIKVSRPISNIVLDKRDLSKGILRIRWKILELGDGGLFQLIVMGNDRLNITGSAIIEGQRAINRISEYGAMSKSSDRNIVIAKTIRFSYRDLIFCFLTAIVSILLMSKAIHLAYLHLIRKREFKSGFFFSCLFVSVWFGIIIIIELHNATILPSFIY